MVDCYKYKVSYTIKHTDRKSPLYNLLSPNQGCRFPTFETAMRFARNMSNKKTSKYRVIGTPIIETIPDVERTRNNA